jgi:hypothetical protein
MRSAAFGMFHFEKTLCLFVLGQFGSVLVLCRLATAIPSSLASGWSSVCTLSVVMAQRFGDETQTDTKMAWLC